MDARTEKRDRGSRRHAARFGGGRFGKTAVLTERVLRRVTDPENPIDITELLLVTFTRAAAAEMRERIAAAIGAAVAQDPSSVRLRRQLFLVHRAKITTVHALCMSLAARAGGRARHRAGFPSDGRKREQDSAF